MQPIRTVEVSPFLRPELECLRTLAYNLRWTWDHETINLFRRLDRDLWERSGHNPVLMLGTINQERLDEAAKDEGFLAKLERVWQKHNHYMKSESTWYKRQNRKPGQDLIAYFSAEFGITEAIPIYSGGLGILAGDHVKAASDLDLPFVAVGIAYQQGYFRQYLSHDGWQQERYPMNDFYNLPIQLVRQENGEPLTVQVELPGRPVNIQVWKAQVGRVPLYLMDTNIPQRRREDEDITDALYHADPDVRIKQEMILGIGGMRVLQALGISPTVCHMNEGHSAFLALEHIKQIMVSEGLSFAEAREVAMAGHAFTTHTAVPAGIDKFAPELTERYVGKYTEVFGISREEFLGLGRSNVHDQGELFSMANLAIKFSATTNAVSKLHGDVSRLLFQSNWKGVPEHEIPITHITNGIHIRSWASDEITDLLDRYLGHRWSEEGGEKHVWKQVEEIPDEELWRIRWRRRERLVNYCRKRIRQQLEQRGATPAELKDAAEILSPDALTLGFARRVATYKRLTLLLRDLERLKSILNKKDQPIQIIIAGKAHPEDTPGKELIRQLIQSCRKESLAHRIVFLEDYDMSVARWLVQGADVWLNTPRRFLEACGTSGMKVVFNGGLNCSILDGWWDEAYDGRCGWAIGHGEVYNDPNYQDDIESAALYDLLEKDIAPLFYDRDKDGIPRGWIAKMKTAMTEICPQFNINRMVREYAAEIYFPSSARFSAFLAETGKRGKELAGWRKSVMANWRDLRIDQVEAQIPDTVKVGDCINVSARIHLGALTPDEVSVQIYHGQLDAYGNIINPEKVRMKATGTVNNETYTYAGEISYFKSGRHGFTLRIVPHHEDQGSPFECGLIHWAQSTSSPSYALST